jgi:hypothetical protein
LGIQNGAKNQEYKHTDEPTAREHLG